MTKNVRKIHSQIQDIVNQIEIVRNAPGSSSSKNISDIQVEMLLDTKHKLEEKEDEERKKLKKKHLVWPSSTRHGNLRNINTIWDISTAIATGRNSDEESEELTREEKLGIVGPSLLLTQPNFNLIKNIPCEYMHSVCLGVVKRLLQLTFKLSVARSKVSTRKLSAPSKFNDLIRDVRVPHEFSRRVRHLDLAIMKAQELRNVILFFFPLVLQCIEDTHPQEHIVWLTLSFMIRACTLPNNEFIHVDKNCIKLCAEQFYTIFNEVFGSQNCSYSIHVVSSHLLQIRGDNPLTFNSAFKFESFYSEMKNCFKPGTTSTLKQLFSNVLMKRIVEYHTCQTTLFLKADKAQKTNGPIVAQAKECNDLIYTCDDTSNDHIIYKIMKINDDNSLSCVRYGQYSVKFPLVPNLNWSSVGVYRAGPTCSIPCNIPRHLVKGKVIRVGIYLITCSSNILREK